MKFETFKSADLDPAQAVRAAHAKDLLLAVSKQREKDKQTIVREVYKIAWEENVIREKMARTRTWSGKWWHYVTQLNILRENLIDGFTETDRFDPSISRQLLLGNWVR